MNPRLATLRRFTRAHWAVVVSAVALLWFFPYLPSLRSPNELSRLRQTRSLVEDGTFEIGRTLEREGMVGDLSCVAIARDARGGVASRAPCPNVANDPRFGERWYYPNKAPLLPVAAVPIDAALRAVHGGPVDETTLLFFARLFLTALPTVLFLIPLRRFLRDAVGDSPAVDALVAVYAVGTLAFSYAQLFMSHQTTAILLFLAFIALYRTGRGERGAWGYVFAGALAALAVAAEYTSALVLPPLVVYGLVTASGSMRGKVRAAALATLGALPFVAALAAYHTVAFGSPFATGYRFLNDLGFQPWHQGGFLGVHLPNARALFLSLFSPLRGLLALSPFLVLTVFGFRRPRSAELWTCLAVIVLYLFFTAGFTYDAWGWATGPRHLAPMVPFLLLPIARFLSQARERGSPIFGGVVAGLALFSVLATGTMTLLNYIPDTLSDALTQVAVPFALRGYLPHSLASLHGVPNPWAALPGLAAILLAGFGAAHFLVPKTRRLVSAAVMLAVCGGLFGLHLLARPTDPERIQFDAATYQFLEKSYQPRPGHASP